MKFERLEINDLVTISPTEIIDDRGYFCENYRINSLNDFLEYEVSFCQENESKSSKNVFRGFHYQIPPFAQSKLVKVNSIVLFPLDAWNDVLVTPLPTSAVAIGTPSTLIVSLSSASACIS